MEEEKVVDNAQEKSNPVSCPSPSGLPINWGLLTGPVPQPGLPILSLGTVSSPPQSSAVHELQTKVTSLTQRKSRGREKEKYKQSTDTEATVNLVAGKISPKVHLRQTPQPAFSQQPGSLKNLSSSDEEEEVEVHIKLEIHRPPVEVQGEQVCKGALATETERSDRNEGLGSSLTVPPCGVEEGNSRESLLSENSRCNSDIPPAPPSAPSICSNITSASTTSSFSSSTISTSSKHWAPPKGFWKVARPETLLLNGVDPHNIPSGLTLKDYTQTESLAKLQQKSKPADAGTRSNLVDDSGVSSEVTHSASVECYLDRHQQKETNVTDPFKGLYKSDSWESISSQSDILSTDEIVKVKHSTYAKLKDRQQNNIEEREQSDHYGDMTHRVHCKGAHEVLDDNSDSTIFSQEREPCSRPLLLVTDELPLSPRHEQAKRLLERARLKARSSPIKGDHPSRRSCSDQRYTVKLVEPLNSAPTEKAVQTKDNLTAPCISGPVIQPKHRHFSQ
ncbi:hypothetical protein LDENG_00063120 [Lucifuga dentata]|nr:hypothetical protein LDENG_00063120 [Lucifuga dentata]